MGWRFDDRSVSVDYLEAGHSQAAAITSSQGIGGKDDLITDDLFWIATFGGLFQCSAGAASPVGNTRRPVVRLSSGISRSTITHSPGPTGMLSTAGGGGDERWTLPQPTATKVKILRRAERMQPSSGEF